MTMTIVALVFIGYFTSGTVAMALVWRFLHGKHDQKTLTDLMVLSFMLGYFSLLGIGVLALSREIVHVVQENFDIEEFMESAKKAAEQIKKEETGGGDTE